MPLPDLPKFPKWSKRVTSSNLDGSIPVLSSSLMARESNELMSLIDDRNRGVLLSVDRDSPISRYHGCRSCPFYGSSFCFEKIVPPMVHLDGICSGRLNEILDIAELYQSPNSLVIRKRETVERIRKHILMLEANLSDYSLKRAELLPKLSDKPLKDDDGDLISPNNVSELGAARANRELQLLQFDGYQRGLQSQIQVLSTKFAELLRDDEKLSIQKGESGGKTVLNIQQLNILLSDSAKRLQELESEKKVE